MVMKQHLMELKLSRVWTHFNSHDYPVGLITAFRGERPFEENLRLNIEMSNIIRKRYGFVWVDGCWVENAGTENELEAKEVSMLVIGNKNDDTALFDQLVELAHRYNQDGFVFKNTLGRTAVYDKDGNEMFAFSALSFDKLSTAYTALRSGSHSGRTFLFTEERQPMSFLSSLIEKHKLT